MPRLTIQQFRDLLAAHSPAHGAVRVYREIARRPTQAAGMRANEWPVWNGAPAR